VTLWESRTSPDFFYKKGRFHERPFFIFWVFSKCGFELFLELL